ncbi:MAG: Xaa-Pro peptidase family protein [Geminicoccaceae bacterium]
MLSLPARPFATFQRAEFEVRIERLRAEMEQERLDALLLTTEANFRYVTGFDSPTWVSPTRPFFCVLPLVGEPCAIIPTGSAVVMAATSWVSDVRTWPAPVPEDDGVSLVAGALAEAGGRFGRIGAELGPELQLRMPALDFMRLRERVAPAAIVDGGMVTRRVRMVKSAGEVARIEQAAQIVSAAFEGLPGIVTAGASEREVCAALRIDLLRRGADATPYLTVCSGRGGYGTINTGPTERRLASGDVLILDTGTQVDGYFCDFDRNFAVGEAPSAAWRELSERLHRALEAGMAAAAPGARCKDVWLAMARVLGEEEVRRADVGRMGHGVGLVLTEPPSIHPNDETMLVPGMVLAIEPGLGFDQPDGRKCVLVHEENVVVTETGCRLLSRRAPLETPVIPLG